MKRETGDKNFKLWLLGDSEPLRWKDKINMPFDDKHPIVHNIWTSVIDKIQDRLYRYNCTRLDSKKLFIRNAVANSDVKPRQNLSNWEELENLLLSIDEYKRLINKYKPDIILSFGSFAFEFGRRCLNEPELHSIRYWNTKMLGEEFRKRLKTTQNPILLPLLHRSIAGGKFLISHEHYCNNQHYNYFEYVANGIFELIKDNDDLKI